MRYIERIAKPKILEQKADTWREAFVGSDKKRPGNSKYAHRQVRDSLNAMSFHKCFYCERKLKDIPKEIDHFIEVAERKELAYDWENLYLACDDCNNKLSNRTIPVDSALNPCRHLDKEIQQHITFEDEIIRAKNDSDIGRGTIQKYKLDSDQLDLVRSRAIQQFHKVLIQIQRNMNKEGRKVRSEREEEILLSFKQKDRSFSLMFTVLLDNHHLM